MSFTSSSVLKCLWLKNDIRVLQMPDACPHRTSALEIKFLLKPNTSTLCGHPRNSLKRTLGHIPSSLKLARYPLPSTFLNLCELSILFSMSRNLSLLPPIPFQIKSNHPHCLLKFTENTS